MTIDDASRILGIKSANPTKQEIDRAYRAKAFLLAPDRLPPNASQEMRDIATEALSELNTAHSYLMANLHNIRQAASQQEQNQNANQEQKKYPAPKLIITPNPIIFTTVGHMEVRTTHLEIRNTGGPCTNFLMATNELPVWLEVTEIKRFLDQALPVQIRIKATGQQIGKKYDYDIPIKAINKQTGYKDEARIRVEMMMKGPELQIDRKNVEFNIISGIIPPPQTVTLHNSGVGYIEGNLTPEEQWIKISPRTISFSNKQDIQIQIDAARLEHDHSSSINIRTNCGTEVITVRAKVHSQQTKTALKSGIVAPSTLYYCSKCKKNTIWYNRHQNRYECLKCKRNKDRPEDFK